MDEKHFYIFHFFCAYCVALQRGSLELARPCSSWDTCMCHIFLIGVKKTVSAVHKREFRISDHSKPPFWITHLTYSTHFYILSLIWSSYVYFCHKVYLYIIHIYSSSLIKWNQQNFHRHCISISYNPLLSKSLLPLSYLTYSFAIIVHHSGSFLWLLFMYMHQRFSWGSSVPKMVLLPLLF